MSDFEDNSLNLHLNSIGKTEDSQTTPSKSSPDKKSRTPIKFSKTGEDIYNRGKEFLNSVELKRQDFAVHEHSFKPKINEKSQKLLQNAIKEGRNPRDKKAKEEVKVEEEPIEEEKKTKPKGDIKGFIERNYTNPVINKKPIEKSNEPDKECTFKPKISDKSKELASSVSVDLFRQAEELQRRKQEKIARAQKEKEDKELVGCTFKPQIMKPVTNISPAGKIRKSNEISGGYAKKASKLFINV